MKQYLLSIYQPDGPPPASVPLGKIMEDVGALRSEMKSAGAWVFSAGLHPADTATVVRVKDISGENYIHRNNCEFAGYADAILAEQGVTCSPAYCSNRDDWTLAMVAAGLGIGFLPEHSATHPGVVALPIIEPEFWRQVNLVSVRGRPHSPAVGAMVREAMHKKWFGSDALGRHDARNQERQSKEPEAMQDEQRP